MKDLQSLQEILQNQKFQKQSCKKKQFLQGSYKFLTFYKNLQESCKMWFSCHPGHAKLFRYD